MRIDRKHFPWFAACIGGSFVAISLHRWLGSGTPRGLGGGTTVGLVYGVLALLLLLFLGALGWHRYLPVRRWLGKRQTWLRFHLWFGLLAIPLVLCHANYRWDGPLAFWLWWVFLAVCVSGVLGAVLQHLLPRLITNTVADEAPFDQVPYLCRRMREEAETAFAEAKTNAGFNDEDALKKLAALREDSLDFLGDEFRRNAELASPARAKGRFDEVKALVGAEEGGTGPLADAQRALDRVLTMCGERRQLGFQVSLHRLLHGWLFAHVPLSMALYALLAAHLITVFW